MGITKSIDKLMHTHTPEAIQERLLKGPAQSYLRDWVYGGIDGAITTFAVVSGVVGASLSPKTILILGFVNLIADGFSMAASNFLSTRAEQEELAHWRKFEEHQVDHEPEGEREEIRQILRLKGFSGDILENAVEVLTANKEKWVDLMLIEEYGLPTQIRSPVKAAANTYLAFVFCGAMSLAPYILGLQSSFTWSCFLTGLTFFLIGSLKSRWSISPWWKSGLLSLLVGGIAAVLAFGAGFALKGL